MKFPYKKYQNLNNFISDYFADFTKAKNNINIKNLEYIILALKKAYMNKKIKIFVCGNGGSAAIANHFECDHKKILSEGTKILNPRIISLCTNNPLITAIANDFSYEEIFSRQLKYLARKGDILITISSSGRSKNIIRALRWSNKNNIKTISFTGFNGGESKKIAKLNIHASSYNYGVVENIHHSIMNIISQFLRQDSNNLKTIRDSYF
jgi:D-sedoheptulose 7-phosphate isomerase/D-glycero-D-manno-heptose 1,7-bisphosphate phosphatase